MNNRRKLLVALGAGTLAAPLLSFAQQQNKVWRIGFLGASSSTGLENRFDALRAGLKELGYVEGKNFLIEYRWADGNYDRLAKLAAELVRLRVDVIMAQGAPGSRAAKLATTTIPIVMTSAGDAIASGLVSNLARPGGNITGSTYFAPELAAKRLELLREAVPHVSRVAILTKPDNPSTAPQLEAVEKAAKSLNLELRGFTARGPKDFADAFAEMVKQRVSAVEILEDAFFNVQTTQLADLAIKSRLPSIGLKELAETGGLLGYGVNFPKIYHDASIYLDKIFKGANPGDLPVERPTVFELVINMKTAKSLGIKIPQSILVRADKVIE